MANKRINWIRKNAGKLTSGRYRKLVGAAYTAAVYEARDLQEVHGTYQFEQMLLENVRLGRPDKLEKLFRQYAAEEGFTEGTVASDDLRQVKNIFVALVAMVGKAAAIPGGMPLEEAYYLIDTYTQHAEELATTEDVYVLQYNMIMDFAERVQAYQYPGPLSPLIRSCRDYIVFHVNEPISVTDVIAFAGISRTGLNTKFKTEIGYEVGAFITKCKIDEAKSLLRFTDRSISEISSYLAFSSQPYFQTVFRKITGMTPLQYRNSF